jgi:hypothetical protein
MSQSKTVVEPLDIIGLDTNYYKSNLSKKDFEKIPNMMVAYFSDKEDLEFPDIINRPTMLISNDLKKLFKLYDEEIEFKGVQLYSDNLMEEKNITACLYWTFMPAECECFHKDSEKYPTGTIKRLILDKEKLIHKDIIKIEGLLENKIIVSLPVAESILRRNMYGIGLEEIEIR